MRGYPVAYGADGQIFRLEAAGGRVRITPLEGAPPRPDELRALVLRYLAATGVQGVENTEDLPSLLARCEAATTRSTTVGDREGEGELGRILRGRRNVRSGSPAAIGFEPKSGRHQRP